MRSSSKGTRARFAAELYRQEEHVTKADMVRRTMSKPRFPITIYTPTIAMRCGDKWAIHKQHKKNRPPRNSILLGLITGPTKSMQPSWLVSTVVRHVKESEGHLSQRINYCVSNAGTGGDSLRGRRVDRQCRSRGSGTVVVGGVTTTQGDGQSRSQGEGFYTLDATDYSDTHGPRRRT